MAGKQQKRYAIIVAAGNGSRMNSALPKQFMLLGGKPVLLYTLQKFHEAGAEIILVLPEQHFLLWEELKNQHAIVIPHKAIAGGRTRSESVFNGIKCVSDPDSYIAVHDAARANVSLNLINSLYVAAFEKGNAVPVIALNDSIRKITSTDNTAVNRDEFRIVQTPQVFKTNELSLALQASSATHFSDEASLMEARGYGIHLINGEQENFKITHAYDLLVAESLLKK